MQIWIHDSKMKKIVSLNNDIPDMLSYTNSTWHSYLDQATSTFDFTIPKFSNGELHEDLKLINDECFVSFYVNGSYQVFYIATLQEDDFNIQLTCNNTNLEYALEYANPFSSESAQTIEWYLNHMELLAFAAVEIGNNEIPDRKRTLTFDSQETKMNRLQSLMSKFEAEFEFKVELNRDGTYKRIVINIYQENHIGTDRKDVVLYYSNGLKGVQVSSDKTQMFNAGVFTGKDGLNLADVEISEKNADGIEEFYSRKGNPYLYAPIAMNRYPATMRAEGQDNWIRKDFTTEYENVNDLKAYALRTLKQYAYPLVTYTASIQSSFVSQYTDLKLGDTIRIIDKNFVGGLALEARVSEMIISFDNPANNSFVFTNYRKLDNKPSSALQTRIEQVIESRLSYRIELATTGGVTFKNNEGETIIKPSLYKGNLPWTKDVTWHWTLNGVVTDGMQYRIQARDIIDTAVLTVDAFVDGKKVATTEITLTNVNDGLQGPQGPQGDEGPQGPQGDEGPKGDKGDTGNGIANTVVTYGLSMSDTTEPATWSSSVPTLVKGMYLWTRTVIIYTNGESTTSYQISYIAKDADATAAIDKTKQELLEKLETVRDDSLAAVEEAKQELVTVRDESLAAAEEAKQQITTVADELSTAKQDFQNAVSAVDTKATNLQSDLSQAKQDLASQAHQLQEQASAQSELTNRVSSVEETANGTKTTVSELSKTVAQNGKDITSVTARTKVVEDDLAGTKTTLSQVQTTANSASQKTATLETGLNGLNAKFETLKIGSRNYFKNSKSRKYYINDVGTQDVRTFIDDEFWQNDTRFTKDYVRMSFDIAFNPALPSDFTTNVHFSASPWYNCGGITFKGGTTDLQHFDLKFNLSGAGKSYKTDNVFIRLNNTLPINTTVSLENFNLYLSAVVEDYSQNEVDIESKVADYKQTADQNYASLQTTVQNLDGTVQHNKTVADQTAAGFSTRIESLETYKDGESERANAYFESAKTETAKQLTAERTAIANNYVAKSTYTSDVTGIRNDLSATTATANTTKTNLANYQASNDRAVTNLQSNLQEANGNISSLKTKVEAVPGQITSAVSSVEGKIPTNVSTRNLILKSNDFANPHKQTGANTTVTSTDGYFVIKSIGYTSDGWGGISWNMSISEVKAGEQFSILMPVYIDSSVPLDNGLAFAIKNHTSNLAAYSYDIPTNKKDQWFNVAITFKASKGFVFDTYPFFVYLNRNGLVRIKPPMLVRGNLIPSDYQPAFEDTDSDITNLNTTLTQTADGLKQLTTQVTSQGGTITSHTNSINSLTTGLQAKVSQSEFNTLSGRVTTAENNITAKANELSSKITSVEGKIPKSASQRNLAQGTSVSWSPFVNITTNNNWRYNLATVNYGDKTGIYAGTTINIFVYLSADEIVLDSSVNPQFFIQGEIIDKSGTPTWTNWDKYHPFYNKWSTNLVSGNNYRIVKLSAKVSNESYSNINGFKVEIRINGVKSGKFHHRALMITTGDVFPDSWSPAPEDAIEEISNLSSEIKQTADGMTLLATKTELNAAKSDLQSGINTATNKANSNAQTISTHTSQISALNTGLQAKVSQTDFNTLSGRVTTAENNITAKANELSSKISSVEGKLPSGEMNLVEYGRPFDGYSPYAGAEYTTHGFYYNGAYKMYIIRNSATSEKVFGMNRFKVERNTDYTLYFKGFNNWKITNMDVWFLKRVSGSKNDYDSAHRLVSNRKLSDSRAEDISVTFNTGEYDEGYLRFDNNGTTTAGTSADLYFGDVSVKKGKSNNGWSPSLAELASSQDLKTAQSEFKQTTDAIKASVSSLDNSTVKSSSLTINADGIVMKAGKSTTDVANAIGSYFSVNQNAINLFSDKINVKGSMIVNGTITGDKIKANSVDVSKISGLDATYLRAKIETAMVDWLKGKTIVADNGATKVDLMRGHINFDSNEPAIRRVTPGIPTQFIKFLKSDNNSVTTIGSNRDGSESSMNDSFAGIKITSSNAIEQTEIISDQIYFLTGVSSGNRRGWQMSTIAGNDSRQITLVPTGNVTKSSIYASDHFIKGNEGWVNLRDFINYINTCLGHLQNYTGRTDIWNPFKF